MAKFFCGGDRIKKADGSPLCAYSAEQRWLGPCPGCGERFAIHKSAHRQPMMNIERTFSKLSEVEVKPRMKTGLPEFDRVLGGGLVGGCTVAMGGKRGVGKTTLLMQVADYVGTHYGDVIYASSEQSEQDLAQAARRVGLKSDRVLVLGNEADAYKLVDLAEEMKPVLVIGDSVQEFMVDDVEADVGSARMVEAVGTYVTSFIKTKDMQKTACILICHYTKGGELAGPEKFFHDVDTIVYFNHAVRIDGEGREDPRFIDVRMLLSDKNRNGPSNVEALLEMTAEGLVPVSAKKQELWMLADDDDESEALIG